MPAKYLANGYIYTLDPDRPSAEAVCIENGRITSIGKNSDVIPAHHTGLDVLDLKGRCVLPGITDAHIHLLEYGSSLMRVDCETATRAECVEQVRNAVAASQQGCWVRGHGWNHNIWPEGAGSRAELDAFSSQNPIYLTHKSLHSAWANSAALKAAGIDSSSPDPENGQIVRDSSGNPTGILLESAMALVEGIIPEPSYDQRLSALHAAQRALNAFGITAVHDFDSWSCYLSLRQMEEIGELSVRVMKSIPFDHLDEAIQMGLQSADGSETLRIGWLKLFSDGALGPQTAAMLKPYEESITCGMLFLDRRDIYEFGIKSVHAGISLAVHAIGDRANREVISGYAQLIHNASCKQVTLPPRIEHVQLISADDIPELASLGIIASMQPIHAVSDRVMAERHWGERCSNAYAWNALQKNGATLIFGSDAPVESPNPFLGLFAAVTRKSITDPSTSNSWIPDQCLTIDQALNAYIKTPQKVAGVGKQCGVLKPGYLADLIVLPVDILKEQPQALLNCLPEMTMVSGKCVFTRNA